MTVDVARYLAGCEDVAGRSANRLASGLKGSTILAIARQVKELQDEGINVRNFTIGDFDPKQFPVPEALSEGIVDALRKRQTQYPPAIGVPELRKAVRDLYADRLGLAYPEGSVQIGSGARPPIYSAFQAIVEPGDAVLYPVPSWNINHYTYLSGARGIPVVTSPETGFMPTAEQLLPHLGEARLVVINSPLNPSGTVIAPDQLEAICRAIVAENDRRRAAAERPLFLLYDQVYWQLVFGDSEHVTPVRLVPEMAPYTIFVDAISKCWAATGLRVGWAVVPPWIRDRMQALVGHMGAWAARPEQIATARLLADPELLGDYTEVFHGGISARLERLQDGLTGLKAEGHPIEVLPAQGALYLSAKVDCIGRRHGDQVLENEEAVRSWLLTEAHIAVVPFSAFGYPANSGWMRWSVGSVSLADVDAAVGRLRAALNQLTD
ncbi:MAG: aminotransferase class I/II-fold pyridoxal phosphate-dependent enzyme [Alphaproteobacteria bacterium]|nr:aminotransferase class I/II-fold pyridoxal phosphate-dependent enzyme [Alphaproteobacteria bacterium]